MKKPTYEEYLKAIIPPTKVVYDNDEWIVVENKGSQYKLMPCLKSTNNGEPIVLPHGTMLTHIQPISYEK